MRHARRKFNLFIGMILLILLFFIPFLHPIQDYFKIPKELTTSNQTFNLPLISSTTDVSSKENLIKVKEDIFQALAPADDSLIYSFHGLPVKKVDVKVLDQFRVIPGGQSVGVQLETLGVLVVGHHLVKKDKDFISPGEEAEIQVGDVILEINDEKVKQMADVTPHVERAGKNNEAIHVTIKRDEQVMTRTLQPVFDTKEKKYRIGLYVRDSASGIGTMTFYDDETKNYGALGHIISDMDTKQPIDIHDGLIMRSKVTSIIPGENGRPGEKKATFSTEHDHIGSITKNSPFGVFGKLNKPIDNKHYPEPIPIALAHEIEKGSAQILTVLDGEEVEAFDIEIVSNSSRKIPSTKGMVIKVTDPKLLEKTGGIIQGMSGSPIIQNDKLIGAVTHVFVNDSSSGYGVHIEWMLQEAGLDIFQAEGQAS